MTPKRVPLGVLDLVPVSSGSDPSTAVHNSIDLARAAEALGYARYWFAEHHLDPGVAGSSPAVLAAAAASATSAIRIGSGGVQSGHRTPLSMVEDFGVLDALAPGRIDLGIRRSGPGVPHHRSSGSGAEPADGPGDVRPRTRAPYRTAEGLLIPKRPPPRTLPAPSAPALATDLLRQKGAESSAYGDVMDDVVHLLAGEAPARPVPGTGANVELWVIGSGEEESASVAGRLGLRFAANYHASPATVLEVIDAYRDAFIPSAALDRPYFAVSAHVVVGSDDRQANELAEGYPLWVLSVRSGQGAMPYPSVEEARLHHWTEEERDLVRDRTETQFVGSAQSVATQLGWLQEATEADELVVATVTHRPEDRVRSYRLLAEEWIGDEGTGGRRPARMHYPVARQSRPDPAPVTQHTR